MNAIDRHWAAEDKINGVIIRLIYTAA